MYRLHGRNMSMTDARGAHKQHPGFLHGRSASAGAEFEILRAHCRKTRNLSRCRIADLLDNELVFVNYRLMARKIRQNYEGSDGDSSWRLWGRGLRLSFAGSSWRAAFANGTWFTLLALAPRRLAAAMVIVRFNRAGLFRSAQRKRRIGPWRFIGLRRRGVLQ